MTQGGGDQKERLASWMSFILGVENMPYCWAAKSSRKEVGASHFAVEKEMPMMLAMEFYMLSTEDGTWWRGYKLCTQLEQCNVVTTVPLIGVWGFFSPLFVFVFVIPQPGQRISGILITIRDSHRYQYKP